MKSKYIESLLSEIQQLEAKVANLEQNKNVSFSFFKDSFKRTQEITRLLHELEFVQIEDMKSQMEKLVHFLSESENNKEEVTVVPIVSDLQKDNDRITSDKEEEITFTADPLHHDNDAIVEIEEAEEKELYLKDREEVVVSQPSHPIPDASRKTKQPVVPPSLPILNAHKETIVDHLNPKSKSLNDVHPINHTLLDTKRSISLNDRFLFQRELFDNNREAMNDMLTKLQSFSTYDSTESYLRENTDWDFKDETVDKFIQMLKESFR